MKLYVPTERGLRFAHDADLRFLDNCPKSPTATSPPTQVLAAAPAPAPRPSGGNAFSTDIAQHEAAHCAVLARRGVQFSRAVITPHDANAEGGVRFTADQLHLAILTQAGCIGLAAGCAAGIASDIQRGRAQAARWATDRQTIDLCTRAYAVHRPGEKLPDPLVEAEADLAAPGMAAAVAFIARTLAIQGTMSFADVVAVVGAHGALIPLSAAPSSAADARAAEDDVIPLTLAE